MKKTLLLLTWIGCYFTALHGQVVSADQLYVARDYKSAAMTYRQNWTPNSPQSHTSRMIDSYRQIGAYQAIYDLLKDQIPGRFSADVVIAGAHAARSVGAYDLAEKWYKAYYRHDPDAARHWVDVLGYTRSQADQPALYKTTIGTFNTTHSDYGATVKGKTLIWTSHRSDIRRVEKQSDQRALADRAQLYQAQKSNGSFTGERFLRSDLKDVYGDTQIKYDMDGRIAVFVKNMAKKDGNTAINGTDPSQGIYIALSDPQTGDWNISEPFPFNSTDYSCAFPFVMNNGRTLYFASNRPDSYGGFDLYVSQKVGGEWSIPKNLGPNINTPGNEITPSINNGQLYFASDYHPGLGGYDIFRAEIVGGDYNRVFNIGKDINSGYDDYDLFLDPRGVLGLFTSNRTGGLGAEDIYHCEKIGGQVKLVVRDADTKEPIAGASIMMDTKSQIYKTGYYGDCTLNVQQVDNGAIRVSKEGYLGKLVPVQVDINTHLIKNYDVFLERDGMVKTTTPTAKKETVTRSEDFKPASTAPTTTTKPAVTITPTKRVEETPKKTMPAIQETKTTTTRVVTQDDVPRTPNGTPLRRPVQNKSTTPSTTVTQRTTTTPSSTQPVVTTTPAETTPPAKKIRSAYAVQLASLSENQGVNLEPYKKLYDLGTIYQLQKGPATKIRLGTYTTETEARAMLDRVKKRGFGDAYLVIQEESMAVSTAPAPAAPPVNRPTVPTGTTAKKDYVRNAQSYGSVSEGYKVRVAALSNLNNFDQSVFNGIGYIEVQRKSAASIVYVAGFDSYDAARNALPAIRNKGFKDAYVVHYKNGIFNAIR